MDSVGKMLTLNLKSYFFSRLVSNIAQQMPDYICSCQVEMLGLIKQLVLAYFSPTISRVQKAI